MDLKRDFRSHNRKRQDDPKYDPALFEKYNFLSPGKLHRKGSCR